MMPGHPMGEAKLEVSPDFKLEADFLHDYLKLERELRMNVSHQFEKGVSAVGTEIRGFVASCTYSGGDCLHKKYHKIPFFIYKSITILLFQVLDQDVLTHIWHLLHLQLCSQPPGSSTKKGLPDRDQQRLQRRALS